VPAHRRCKRDVATEVGAVAGGEGDRETASLRVPLLLTLSGVSFAALLNVSALGPFVAPISNDLDTPVSTIGLAATAGLVTTALCGLVVGWLADRAGFRPVLLVGLGLLVAGALGVAASYSFTVFVLARVVGSIGFTAALGVPNAIVATHYEAERRQRGLAWLSAASVLAGLAGPPALTLVGDLWSWRAAFAVVAVLALVVTVGAAIGLPAERENRGAASDSPDLAGTYRALLRSPSVLRLFGATILQMAGHIGSFIYLGAFLVEAIDLELRFVGLAFAVQGAGGLAGSYVAGRMRIDHPSATYTVSLGVLAATLVIIYGVGPAPLVIMGLLALNGASQLVAWITLVGALARVSPVRQGATMVLNGSMLGVGGALGSALGAYAIATWGYGTLGVLPPALIVLSAILFLGVRER
jgi:MFS transporter, DHA1 family, inner membrane transport protein